MAGGDEETVDPRDVHEELRNLTGSGKETIEQIDLHKVLAQTRQWKTQKWSETWNDCDLVGMVQAWSHGAPVLFAFPHESREQTAMTMEMLGTLAKGLLVVVSDAYHAKQPLKTDGTEWQPGDMQNAWKNNTADKALLGEGIMCVVFDRDGNVGMASQNYEATETELLWGKEEVSSEGLMHPGGAYVELGRKVMTSRSLFEAMEKMVGSVDTFGLTEDEAEVHAACAVAKMLCEMGVKSAIAVTSGHLGEIVDRSLEGYEVEMMK